MRNLENQSVEEKGRHPAVLFLAPHLQLGAAYSPYAVFDVSKNGGEMVSNKFVDILKGGSVDFRTVVNGMTVTILTRKKVEQEGVENIDLRDSYIGNIRSAVSGKVRASL